MVMPVERPSLARLWATPSLSLYMKRDMRLDRFTNSLSCYPSLPECKTFMFLCLLRPPRIRCIPETTVCRILVFLWSLGPLI